MAAGRSILIVEDDTVVLEVLADHLAGVHGLTIFTAQTLDEAGRIVLGERRPFDAILLDVGLPDGDGRDFCADLRRRGYRMPIILLTGRGDEHDVVHGLDAGANDYIAKPFRMNELLARLRAQWRVADSSDEAAFAFGPYIFRPSRKLLHDRTGDRRIRLTTTEVAILKYLYQSEARRVDREKLVAEIWGQDARANTHTLETHIYRLRQKIETDPRFPSLLVFEQGGYRLDLFGGESTGA
jgi:DNA-binding response OmpR family regulator